ncbi:MAG: hypothetical protein DMG60_20935 [Acidobacteria bacterium]|nr:MAG: hypothetical protein DMG60_20935 [Acidobacteriota bacterium]
MSSAFQFGDEKGIDMRRTSRWLVVLGTAIVFSQALVAESWQATVGAQSTDKGVQVLAFLPNEIWIHTGDSITWTFDSDEAHSVTFLKTGQARPTFAAGCPGTTPMSPTPEVNSSTCVNSGLITTPGMTYTVVFTSPGNYTLLCLLHVNQTGIIHVMDPLVPLPHDQDFYDRQASLEQRDLLYDRDGGLPKKFKEDSPHSDGENRHAHNHLVVTGAGEIVATPGGAQSVSLMRFMQHSVTIHAGETVEWDSSDVSGHSVTFGDDTGITPLTPRSSNVVADSDGALHAVVSSTSDNVHSGRIAPAPQERTNLASVPGVTRFRVTFPIPGTYPYKCAFHDGLGMVGEVIVLP